MSELSIALIIAAYGAVLSTIALSWNIISYCTDKGKLKVICYLSKLIPGDNTSKLTYKITNVGRKSILINYIGGRTKATPENFMINPMHLNIEYPKKLEPGEQLIVYISDLSVLNDNLVSLHVEDTLGRIYKVEKSSMKKLIKDLKVKKYNQ